MSAIGSMVGAQEGLEAGLVTGGLAANEQHITTAVVVGLGATAAGVVLGHQVGESSLKLIDRYIGDGGVGFVPAVAIGGSIAWHNLRAKAPSQQTKNVIHGLPYVLGAGFAAFEGVEAGILTASTQSSLAYAEAVTLGATAATVAFFGGVKALAGKISPRNALRAARGIALGPAIYLAAKATPDLYNDPKPAGVVIAVAGATAMAGAVASFFKKKEPAPVTVNAE